MKKLKVLPTDDIDLSAILDAFSDDEWKESIEVTGPIKLFSAEPPSFITLFVDWNWWQQLLSFSSAAIISGYLAKAGSDLWGTQLKLIKKSSPKVSEFCASLFRLRANLKDRTSISLGFEIPDSHYKIELHLKVEDQELITYQLVLLWYHSKKLMQYVTSQEFNSALDGYITINDDGSLLLQWCEKSSNEPNSKIFHVENDS